MLLRALGLSGVSVRGVAAQRVCRWRGMGCDGLCWLGACCLTGESDWLCECESEYCWAFLMPLAVSCGAWSCVRVLVVDERDKGVRWMPWRQEAMKDVARCEKPRGDASDR